MIFENFGVKYDNKEIYKSLNLTISDNAITCIIGSSGCGKTTLLNAVAGIVPYSGKIIKNSEKISYIFQKTTLFSHLTIGQNIDLILKNVITDKKEREIRIKKILEDVELEKEKNSYPATLSGGMAQRVSLARAFSYPSDILLMDEPFTGIDIVLKSKIIMLFLKLFKEYPKTVLWITHDISDAVEYAEQVVLLKGKDEYELFDIKKMKEENGLTIDAISKIINESICQC